MKAIALSLLVAFAAHAADGGYDIREYDAGTVLDAPLACLPLPDAQRLDIDFRATEGDRDGYRAAFLAMTGAGLVVTVVAGVLAAALAVSKK